ncbi:MAG: hypothetical protein P4N41_12390 [Negativicutes bacterium]|nr:hypothetical protein [Negativicutes bacterium]
MEEQTNRFFVLYKDQLENIIAKIEENRRKNPLAAEAITLVISNQDKCLKIFQRAAHDWIYFDEEQVCEWNAHE